MVPCPAFLIAENFISHSLLDYEKNDCLEDIFHVQFIQENSCNWCFSPKRHVKHTYNSKVHTIDACPSSSLSCT